MDYNFSGLIADQLEKLEKKLKSVKKAFVKEYQTGMTIIQHDTINSTLMMIEDLLNDYINRSIALWTEALNKVKNKL